LKVYPKEYHVNKSKDNLVKFISNAPLENFEGVTNHIHGYMYLQSLDDLTDNQIYRKLEIETGGHFFKIFLSNSTELNQTQFLSGADKSFDDGDLRLGFMITRLLFL